MANRKRTRPRRLGDQRDVPFTPEATVGPFFPGVFVSQMRQDLVRVAPLLALQPQGQPVSLAGRVLDAAGSPVANAILEFWQANAHGRYRHPLDRSGRALDAQFDGFARLFTEADGSFRLVTIKPGAHPSHDKQHIRAPHLRLTLFASGIDRLYTQLFFADEPLNASDPVLASVGNAARERLIAERVRADDHEGIAAYRLDIVMRGDDETPFFDDWA